VKDHKNLQNKFRKGFTLIELIVVISILGILLSLAMVSYGGLRDKAVETVCKHNVRILNQGYDSFLKENNFQDAVAVRETYHENEYELTNKIICPNNGSISYTNNGFICEIHSPIGEIEYIEDDLEEGNTTEGNQDISNESENLEDDVSEEDIDSDISEDVSEETGPNENDIDDDSYFFDDPPPEDDDEDIITPPVNTDPDPDDDSGGEVPFL
jgi:prepilin-type N-terminal cleavage/methylation domain-containing protein